MKSSAKRLTSRLRPAKPPKKRAIARAARPVRRESDIPLEVIEKTYTPAQTSLKTSFRVTGEDQQRDQEFAGGHVDDRWNDEDHFTNKSGDPRVGTHGRSYEPGEGNKRR
jgi:hypothetical protein